MAETTIKVKDKKLETLRLVTFGVDYKTKKNVVRYRKGETHAMHVDVATRIADRLNDGKPDKDGNLPKLDPKVLKVEKFSTAEDLNERLGVKAVEEEDESK